MAKIFLSQKAAAELKQWVARASASLKDPIPWLSWCGVTDRSKHAEGWSILLCPRAGMEPSIQNIEGIDIVVSEQSFMKHPVVELRIDFAGDRFTFNGAPGV